MLVRLSSKSDLINEKCFFLFLTHLYVGDEGHLRLNIWNRSKKWKKIVENEFLKDEAKKKIIKPKTDFDSLLKIKYTF